MLLVGVAMPVTAYMSGAGLETLAWMLAIFLVVLVVVVINVVRKGRGRADISVSVDLGHEMDLLVQQIEVTSKDMLGYVRKELTQVRSLVSDAIKVLQNSFIDLNQDTWTQTRMMQDTLDRLRQACNAGLRGEDISNEIEEINGLADRRLKEMSEITQRINKSIADLVRSLQFEDIVRQLTGSSERHLDYLASILRTVDIGVRNLNSQRISVLEYIAGLHALKAQIDRIEAESSADAARSVSQESMNVGDVSLF